jgi:hypothetical protein
MRIVAGGTVIASRAKTDAASCCFPNICVLPGGRWLVGVRLAPAKSSRTQRAFVTWSDDQGATWSDPVQPATPQELAGRLGTWRAIAMSPLGGARVLAGLAWEDYSRPLLPMFNEQTEGLMDMKLFTAVSEDAGEHFSKPTLVDCGHYRDVPTPITGAPLIISASEWAVQFEVNKHYDDESPWQHVSALTFTSDGGRTWDRCVDVHTDPARRIVCWDQRLAILSDDSTLALFWTFDRAANAYLNIHARSSQDGGRTWDALQDTGVPGQPARAVGLPDGRIVMTYVDRTAAPVIKARLSHDGGRSWPAKSEIIVHQRSAATQTIEKRSMQDAWAEMSAFSIGLPDATLLADGDVLVVYYTGSNPDYTDVHWARIRVE